VALTLPDAAGTGFDGFAAQAKETGIVLVGDKPNASLEPGGSRVAAHTRGTDEVSIVDPPDAAKMIGRFIVFSESSLTPARLAACAADSEGKDGPCRKNCHTFKQSDTATKAMRTCFECSKTGFSHPADGGRNEPSVANCEQGINDGPVSASRDLGRGCGLFRTARGFMSPRPGDGPPD
jgi:hypothetical protein